MLFYNLLFSLSNLVLVVIYYGTTLGKFYFKINSSLSIIVERMNDNIFNEWADISLANVLHIAITIFKLLKNLKC